MSRPIRRRAVSLVFESLLLLNIYWNVSVKSDHFTYSSSREEVGKVSDQPEASEGILKLESLRKDTTRFMNFFRKVCGNMKWYWRNRIYEKRTIYGWTLDIFFYSSQKCEHTKKCGDTIWQFATSHKVHNLLSLIRYTHSQKIGNQTNLNVFCGM